MEFGFEALQPSDGVAYNPIRVENRSELALPSSLDWHSGMIFTKREGQLVLTSLMPHMAEMPLTPAQLDAQQRADFEIIKKNFWLAGVPVVDPQKLIKERNGQ